MQRRNFLKRTGATGLALATLPGLAGQFTVKALAAADPNVVQMLESTDRILVLIQLPGGNDGLNTIIPYTDPTYYASRPDIGIPKAKALKVTDTLGMHPRMTGFHDLYQNGKLAIVQGVTYPNPDRSHFRGTDIWLTATDADVFGSTGWIGRYLQTLAPADPSQLPEHPLAIQIGTSQSLGLQAQRGSMGITFRDPDEFYNLVNSGESLEEVPGSDQLDTPAGREVAYMRSVARSADVYASVVKAAADADVNPSDDFPATDIGAKLRVVAQLIRGRLKTRVYLVSWAGNNFDTHANQTNADDPAAGFHAGLLGQMSDAVAAFMKDMTKNGLADKVAGMTFSEFGRRVAQNGSLGTDHGTAAPLFVFGADVDGGKVFGKDPDLLNLDDRGDLLMEHDYRDVYASVLLQWFGSPGATTRDVLLKDFSPTAVPLFRNPLASVAEQRPSHCAIRSIGPNPARDRVTVQVDADYGADVGLTLSDVRGRTVRTVAVDAWSGVATFDVQGLAPGAYVLSLQVNRSVTHGVLNVCR